MVEQEGQSSFESSKHQIKHRQLRCYFTVNYF